MANRGGARPGAGRKPRWGVPTVAMRVPESMRQEIEQYIWDRLFGGRGPAQDSAQSADRVAELEAENERLLDRVMDLQHQLDIARAHLQKAQHDLERERTTRPIYLESGGRCQARTKSGTRCKRRAAGRITVRAAGFMYEIHVCTRHHEQHKSRPIGGDSPIWVAREFLPD